jgi:sugar O-acyltransferase (sialic acid O-acetyltransferase NeuD family)
VKGVLIIGAGGHGQVVADTLLQAHDAGSDHGPIGFLDDDPALTGTMILGIPVLGAVAQLDEHDPDAVIVAIGDNRVRARLFRLIQSRGEQLVNAVHPSAIIGEDVEVGEGVTICPGAIVNTGARIGDNVLLNTSCTVSHHNLIGDHVHIAPGVTLGGDVQIGGGTLVGVGATVMPRVRVGRWSVVSAGALVHSNVGDNVVVAGVPARAIRRIAGGD